MTFVLSNGTRIEVGARSVVTTLPDGRCVEAHPQGNATQTATARELGYGDDVDAMTRDHDPLHSRLADMLGLPSSFALRVAAGDDDEETRRLAELEEAAVIAVQRFMRAACGNVTPLA